MQELADLKHLEQLDLLDTLVTEEGVKTLKRKLPDTFIRHRVRQTPRPAGQ
jgi:hypothetical protein